MGIAQVIAKEKIQLEIINHDQFYAWKIVTIVEHSKSNIIS